MNFSGMTLEDDHEECQRVIASLNAVIASQRVTIGDMADRLSDVMDHDHPEKCMYRDQVVELTQERDRYRATLQKVAERSLAVPGVREVISALDKKLVEP